jgi:probable O-glycosylation ligase (exosortase A-associated)
MGAREALLLIVVSGICLGSLVRPRIALYGYLWFALMRPDLLAFAEDKYPFSLILAAATGLGALRCLSGFGALIRSATSRWLCLLQVPLAISYVLALRPELSVERYDFYVRMMMVLFCIPVMIQTEEQLRTLILVLALSLGAMGVKFGAFGILHGGVILEGGYGNMLDDNNFLALALAMLIPLCWYSLTFTTSPVLKGILIAIIGASIAQIIMSHSRGGSLALAIGFGVMGLRSRRKWAFVTVVGTCVGVAIYLVQDTYFKRIQTISAPAEEASAASRFVHANAAIAIWKDHPIIGVGFGGFNYAVLAPQYGGPADGAHVAHNSYLQMLVDSGIVSFLIYVWILVGAIIRMGKSAAFWSKVDPPRTAIPYALQTSLIIFAIGARFDSCQRMDFPYMLLLCTACWEVIERDLKIHIAEPTEQTDIETEAVPGVVPI